MDKRQRFQDWNRRDVEQGTGSSELGARSCNAFLVINGILQFIQNCSHWRDAGTGVMWDRRPVLLNSLAAET